MGEQETGFVRSAGESEPFSLAPGWPSLVRAEGADAEGADTGGVLGAVEETVAPGEGPPVHVHRRGDELFYVLEGTFTFLIAGRRREGRVGTVAFVPHGTAHTWQNTGGVPDRMLFVFTPAGFERALADLARCY